MSWLGVASSIANVASKAVPFFDIHTIQENARTNTACAKYLDDVSTIHGLGTGLLADDLLSLYQIRRIYAKNTKTEKDAEEFKQCIGPTAYGFIVAKNLKFWPALVRAITVVLVLTIFVSIIILAATTSKFTPTRPKTFPYSSPFSKKRDDWF